MKLLRNCSNILYTLCFIAAVCVFYYGAFRYFEEGKVTLVDKRVSAGVVGMRRNEEFGDKSGMRVMVEADKDEDLREDSDDAITDIWGSSDEDKKLSGLEKEEDSSSSSRDLKVVRKKGGATGETVLKILDFNHRKCCPLNYSFSGCEYSACALTEDPDQADLVMINGARLKLQPLPPRHPGQIWLMYTKEPPTFNRFRFLARADLRHQINWTRCIFRDSTFRGHYGALESRPPPDIDYEKIFALKKYQVAWFVSNCESQSKRGEYVSRLSSQIDVHIFGLCGNRSCGRHGLSLGLLGSQDPCLSQVSTDYKFYLAFENSLCSDYVTEKFYKVFENVNVIPVVRGGANYTELAPTGTYINAKDFKTPEELGRYLTKLSRNKMEYLRMLKLKDRYTNTFPKPRYPCELCKALHTRRHVTSMYDNMLTWMTDHCWEPNDL